MEAVKICPKLMKNGPCGGYKNGMCEVCQELKCFFVAVWEQNPNSLKRER